MWAFDDYPEEDMLMVDGCKEAALIMVSRSEKTG